jgi:Ca2+-binding EF-hand superfamily protein
MHRHPSNKPAPSRAGFFFSGLGASMLIAALACAAPSAFAQVNATGDYLSRMDGDHDGRVSLTEYQDWMSYAFTRMDLDGDGMLSTAELPGGRGKPVSLAEHRDTLAATFRRQDRNRDGFLDARELSAPPQ